MRSGSWIVPLMLLHAAAFVTGHFWSPETVHSSDGLAASKSLPTDLLADAVFDDRQDVSRDQQQRYAIEAKRGAEDNDSQNSVARTFGLRGRRIQMFFMLPVMYKLGVITTLLTGLVVLTLKGVTIGVILLVIALTGLVAKLSKFQHPYGPSLMPAVSSWSGYYHDPYDRSSQVQQPPLSPPSPQDKNIHVHVHTAPGPVSAGYAKVPLAEYDINNDDNNNINNNVNKNYYKGGGAYWNRGGGDEYYYDTDAMNQYHRANHLQLGVESTTAGDSVYHRWLG